MPSPDRQRKLAHQSRKADEARKESAKLKDGQGKARAAASKPKLGPGLGPSNPVAPDKRPGARGSEKRSARATEKKK